MTRELAPAPPKGYRPSIPTSVKFECVVNQEGCCLSCGKKLGKWTDTQFDHVPALQLRGWDEVAHDTIPPANDPGSIHAIHKDCHAVKTHGRKGESRLSKSGGDISEVAKLRRLTSKELEFRNRLLAKSENEEAGETESPKKRKHKWPSRPFPGSKRDRDSRSKRGESNG